MLLLPTSTESLQMLSGAEPKQGSPPGSSSLSTSADADDLTVPDPVRDPDTLNRDAGSSAPTKSVYCTSAECRLELRSERQLFDQPISSVPRLASRTPRNSIKLAIVDEGQPLLSDERPTVELELSGTAVQLTQSKDLTLPWHNNGPHRCNS